MARGLRALLFILASLAASTVPSAVQAANFWEKNFWLSGPRYDAVIPPCDYPAALERIADRFSSKESRFWNSDLKILEIDRVREVAVRPWAVDTIPRRFCSGVAAISDGKRRRVYYSIIEDGGMIGAKWGVEWCVVGLDRNWAYNPSCRMAQP